MDGRPVSAATSWQIANILKIKDFRQFSYLAIGGVTGPQAQINLSKVSDEAIPVSYGGQLSVLS